MDWSSKIIRRTVIEPMILIKKVTVNNKLMAMIVYRTGKLILSLFLSYPYDLKAKTFRAIPKSK